MGKLGNGGSHCQDFGRVRARKCSKGQLFYLQIAEQHYREDFSVCFKSNASSLGRTKMMAKLASMLRVVPPFRWVCHHGFFFCVQFVTDKNECRKRNACAPSSASFDDIAEKNLRRIGQHRLVSGRQA